jgi:transcription elongation factor SPT4
MASIAPQETDPEKIDEIKSHLPDSIKSLRACIRCRIIMTKKQFFDLGCPTCEDYLDMKQNENRVLACTSTNFRGFVSVIRPGAFVSRFTGLDKRDPGLYALTVLGKIPDSIMNQSEYEEEAELPLPSQPAPSAGSRQPAPRPKPKKKTKPPTSKKPKVAGAASAGAAAPTSPEASGSESDDADELPDNIRDALAGMASPAPAPASPERPAKAPASPVSLQQHKGPVPDTPVGGVEGVSSVGTPGVIAAGGTATPGMRPPSDGTPAGQVPQGPQPQTLAHPAPAEAGQPGQKRGAPDSQSDEAEKKPRLDAGSSAADGAAGAGLDEDDLKELDEEFDKLVDAEAA